MRYFQTTSHLYTLIPSSSSSSSLDLGQHNQPPYSEKVMAGPSSYPASIPLLLSRSGSTSSQSSSSSSTYYEKHVRFDLPRRSGESDLDLDAEIAALDDLEKASETHSLLPFSLPWRRDSASSTSSSSSTASSSYFKRQLHFQRRHRPILISFGAICAFFGSLAIAYLVIDELLPEWPERATNWLSSTQAQIPVSDFGDAATGELDWPDSIVSNNTITGSAIALPFDPTNVLIPSRELPPAPALLRPLEDRLPYPLLEEYFSTGRLPASVDATNAPKQHKLDLVYLWVNATSPYLQQALEDRAAEEGASVKGKKRHWRDNGELRGAVRSAVKSLGQRAGQVHVLSADVAVRPEDEPELGLRPKTENSTDERNSIADERDGTAWSVGQIPKWLNWDPQGPNEKLKWHFHSDIFRLPSDNGRVLLSSGSEEWVFKNEEDWRKVAMPSFNSFAIESRIAWIDGLSENFIACNDDMFMMRELATSDFRNPLLGNMIRMDPGLLVEPFMRPNQLSDSGEWGGLQHANQLLSGRFPVRKRMYMHHLPKTQAKALAHEASVMWAKDLTLAATRGFRESKRGQGDVEMAWIITHLRVERWREALLWSWIVGKVGGVDGVWDEDSRKQMRDVLLMTEQEGDEKLFVELSRGERKTLEDLDGLMEQAGWEAPKATNYHWSSMDGHLPSRPDQPVLNAQSLCTFNLAICLAPDFFSNPQKGHSASDIFSRIAFSSPGCGDCLINALVRASGERGIEAFLPSKEQVFHPKKSDEPELWQRSEPILPLVGSWAEGDFSVAANVRAGQDVWAGAEAREDGGVELRRWCIKLLSRYNYVFAGTASRFSQVKTAFQLSNELRQIDASPDIAMVCINDDQGDRANNAASERFGKWMEERWGGDIEGVDWERSDVPWVGEQPQAQPRAEGEERMKRTRRRTISYEEDNDDPTIKKFGEKHRDRILIWTGPPARHE